MLKDYSIFNGLTNRDFKNQHFITALLLGILLIVSGCGGDQGSGGDDDWIIADPVAEGLTTEALVTAAARVGNLRKRYCFTVIKNGKLVHDTSYGDVSNLIYEPYSASKSFMAVLVGIAEYQGFLSVDDRVSDWLDELPETMHPDATIKHVLAHTAKGELGTEFGYNSGPVVRTLGKIVSAATGMPSRQFADEAFFGPLNIQYSRWRTDSEGNVDAASGMDTSCREMAKIGQLLLDEGEWQGERLLSTQFVYDMTHPPYPEVNRNYGYLTWLNWEDGEWVRPLGTGTGRMLKRAPANVYMATGFFGQLLIVIPDSNMVVTTMGLTFQVETLNTLQRVWDIILPLTIPTTE
ncbi:MAG: beta-lactamase family protein [Pseudomonadales bacterium]|nr:beta-lactamase family protein [Pseudomonadales bacterium]